MAIQECKLYMFEDTDRIGEGRKYVSAYREHEMDHCKSHVFLLGEIFVPVDFPELDTRQLQIDALEQQIQKERADSQVRVNLLLDRISKLKAIAHEVAE